MTIKQLSVFLENKTGRINDVTKTLAKYDINMHAFSMAESTDFGILRLIVSDVEKAVEVLRAENFAVMLNACILISYFANVLVTSFILPVLFSRKTDNCLIVISHTFLF